MSQLLLNTHSGMAKEAAAAREAEKEAAHDRMIASMYERRRAPAPLDNQQSTGAATQPGNDPQRPA